MWTTPYGMLVGKKGQRRKALTLKDKPSFRCFDCDVPLVEVKPYNFICPSCKMGYGFSWNYLKEGHHSEELATLLEQMSPEEIGGQEWGKAEPCPECGGILQLKYGKYGWFYGCNNYPKCTYTKKAVFNDRVIRE